MSIFDRIADFRETTQNAKQAAQRAAEAAKEATEAAAKQAEAEAALRGWFEDLIPTMPWEKSSAAPSTNQETA